MASDSQLGLGSTTLSGAAVSVLDKFLSDSNPSSKITSDAGNGSKIVVQSGGAGDINIAVTPPTKPSTGSLSEGVGKTLNYQLPANTGMASKSIDAPSQADAQTYIGNIVDKYIPSVSASPADLLIKSSFTLALGKSLSALSFGSTAPKLQVRTFDFFFGVAPSSSQLQDSSHQSFAILDSDGSYQGIDSLVGANDILLDAGTSTGSQLFVINLAGISGKTLALQNVEAAVLASPGTVRVEGNSPIRISSDNQAQNITGGGGNDTLVGTGNDTLTGGAGNDVFGFSGTGKYTVTDFNKAGDMLAVDIAGVTNIDQLNAKITSVVNTSTGVTYNLGPDTAVTLVGVTAADLTASMIKFTIT